MKRTPLARKTPLRNRPKAKISDGELAEMAAFKASIAGLPCAICGKSEREALEWTRKQLGYALGHQAHHVIKAQTLRRLGLPEWDPRIAAPLCEEPCHRQVTSAKRKMRREEVPPAALEYVAEHGLGLELERMLA